MAQPRGARNDASVYGQSGGQGQQQTDYTGGGASEGSGAAAATPNPMPTGGMGNAPFDPQVSHWLSGFTFLLIVIIRRRLRACISVCSHIYKA